MTKTLADVQTGEKGVVVRVDGTGKTRRRLFDIGVTPGACFYFRKKAPLGDPIEITLRGYELSLRQAEAALVTVETEVIR